jgi:DNA-binding NtrC family response regulator
MVKNCPAYIRDWNTRERGYSDSFLAARCSLLKSAEGMSSSETMEALIRYPRPGNIRELQNVIERSVVIHQR